MKGNDQLMEWTRSETLALAKNHCQHCHGYGMLPGRRKGSERPCDCVYRAIFRACYTRFRECVEAEKHLSTVTLDVTGSGSSGRRSYGRKVEEYIADFCNVSGRALSEEQHRIFRYYFLLGADSNACARINQMDRGTFFHNVYRIEAILGRTFRNLEPYCLFPVDQYFGGFTRKPPVAQPASTQVRSTKSRRIAPATLPGPRPDLLKIA